METREKQATRRIMMSKFPLFFAVVALGLGLGRVRLDAAPVDFDSAVKPFLERQCLDCHSTEMKKGGLDLESLAPLFATPEQRARWTLVFDRIERGEMPPAKKARPPAEAQHQALRWIGTNIAEA